VVDWCDEALRLMALKTIEDDESIGTGFPYVTAEDGSWKTMRASLSAAYTPSGWTHGNWFCGFWVGLLVAGYLHTRDERFLAAARERQQLISPRTMDSNTHDIGFLFWSGALPLYRATGDTKYADQAIEAAEQLRRRLVMTNTGSYLSSWGPLDDERARVSSAIDTMANLPLLYWAAGETGDASFTLTGEAHAQMTQSAFIRPDYSTYHAVEYDLPSGARRRGYTFQGYSDESAWSRGQAWAVYGFVATAAATGKSEYLAVAERLAHYFLARLGVEKVPYWDFDDPAIPNSPRDSSAGAILASALLSLAELHPDQARGAAWRDRGEAIAQAISECCLARESAHRGVLKSGCYSLPHSEGTNSAVMFGDYYFIEALCKIALPGQLQAQFRPLSPSGVA
jgi:unsaturated chondroitin disaccharide hydrolase